MTTNKYLYIGKYETKIPFEDLKNNLQLVKKIGRTDNLKVREKQLSKGITTDFLSMKFIKAWVIPNENVERAVHALLENERFERTEWFYDDEDNLVSRLSKFMEEMRYNEHKMDKTNENFDKHEYDLQALKERVDLLVDEKFSVKRAGFNFEVTIRKNKEEIVFYSHYLDQEFIQSFNSAFRQSFIQYFNNEDKQIKGVNAWFHPKNAEGKNAYEVIRKKLNKN